MFYANIYIAHCTSEMALTAHFCINNWKAIKKVCRKNAFISEHPLIALNIKP